MMLNVAQALCDVGLLKGQNYRSVLTEIEQGRIDRRSQLLAHVYEQFLRENNLSPSLLKAFKLKVLDEALLNELLGALNQLETTGILSGLAYRQLSSNITSGRIRAPQDLYAEAATWMALYETLEPDRIAPRLDSLQDVGILSTTGRTELLAALRAEILNHPIEFLQYINQGVLIDLRHYSDQPEEYFPRIHQVIAEMLIETGIVDDRFGDFDLAIRLNEASRSLASAQALAESTGLAIEACLNYEAVVSVEVNGHHYRHASFYAPPLDEWSFLSRLETEEFINLFNKILRDQASPYRLYIAEAGIASPQISFGSPVYLNEWFGVVALTVEQANVYFGRDISQHARLPELTSDRLEAILTLFEQIGLVEHLTRDQIETGRDRIAQSYITRSYELFDAFDNVLLSFEWESGNIENPYQELTNEFAAISRGYFAPTQVTNEFNRDTQTAGQTFVLNGTEYSQTLRFKGDWLDPEFFEFIQTVAEQEVSQGQFYAIYDTYDMIGYVFLTEVQYELLQAEGLFQFEPVSLP